MQGMEITVNSQPKTIAEQVSLLQLLEAMNSASQKGIAVAVNQTVIPKTEWQNYFLKQNDNVLIIKATQGG